MENNPSVAEMDNKLFISSLDKLNLTPPELISGGDGVFIEEDEKPSLRLLEKGQVNLAQPNKKEYDLIESEQEGLPFDSILKKDEAKPKESKKEGFPNKQDPSFMDSFLIELVHNIKNSLGSIYHATVLTMDKYDDVEIRKHSHTQVKEDIKKIDSVLNSVLNFININTPIIKTNTLYVILEEILEANEKQLRQKNIKINQKYEKDLPDTFIHPEQVRFILHSVLQYVILSTPPNKSIGFLIKSMDVTHGMETEKTLPDNNRRYIEVMIGFNGDRKPVTPTEDLSETPGDPKEGMANLILKLAKEILQRNHGMMMETHGKRQGTVITLRFPIERRKVVYYEPIAL
jgi:nitrogen-specific signal transduction histidine kinase